LSGTININGNEILFSEGANLLSIAASNGFYIPFSCKDGRCKSCEVEVATQGSQKFEKVLACKFNVKDSIDCRVQNLLDRKLPAQMSFPVKLSDIQKLSAQHFRVTLKFPQSLNFEYIEGQYIDLIFRSGEVRSYSILSVSENTISLYVTRLNHGTFSRFLTNMKNIGSRLNLRGPKGSAILQANSSNLNILFIVTGSGISPVFNILMNNVFSVKPSVFWGLRKDIDYPTLIGETISRLADLKVCYSSDNIRVTSEYNNIKFTKYDLIYIAGNPQMIDELKAYLEESQTFGGVKYITDPFYYQAEEN
jgi:CDP-4-dehydro-6-deoxyglucose reductase, E3